MSILYFSPRYNTKEPESNLRGMKVLMDRYQEYRMACAFPVKRYYPDVYARIEERYLKGLCINRIVDSNESNTAVIWSVILFMLLYVLL